MLLPTALASPDLKSVNNVLAKNDTGTSVTPTLCLARTPAADTTEIVSVAGPADRVPWPSVVLVAITGIVMAREPVASTPGSPPKSTSGLHAARATFF